MDERTELLKGLLDKQTDRERLDLLRRYKNIKLYRYRLYNGNQDYEFEARIMSLRH